MFSKSSGRRNQLNTMFRVTLVLLFALLITRDGVNSVIPTDKDSLMAFKSMLSIESLATLSSWNQSSSPCNNWTGIICHKRNQRVVSIDLSGFQLSGSITPKIGNISFLESLQIQDNYFRGTLPIQIWNLDRLRVLNVSNNNIQGKLDQPISQLYDLRVLGLGENQFSGELPDEEIGNLTKLEILKLGKNKFSGKVPPSIANLSSLTTLDLNNNNFSGTIPNELGRLRTLEFLDLSMDQLSGSVPPSLYNITSLLHFNLASNQLGSRLPSNIGEMLPNLVFFSFCYNNFIGPIPKSLCNLTNIVQFRMSHCYLSGELPQGLGNLPHLEMFLMGFNRIVSSSDNGLSFITDLANSTRLKFLAMDENRLEGRIPDSIGNLSKVLNKLYLGGNRIYGEIPPSISLLTGLNLLNLSHNAISGEIPPQLDRMENLQVLILAKNKMIGKIPDSLGNLQMLFNIDLSKNDLVGTVPSSLRNSYESMDLSSNRLNGSIPKEILGLQTLLNLSNNMLGGSLPEEIGVLKGVVTIDLSNNQLSGNISSSIGDCKSLEKLYLAKNFFSGDIPTSLGELKGLESLDLSSNRLSGLIPVELEKLQVLKFLNLSFNDLEGEIPMDGIFKNTSRFDVESNPRLLMFAAKDEREINVLALIGIIIASVAILCFLVFGALIFLYLKRGKRSNAKTSNTETAAQHQMISFKQLCKATGDFDLENLIGKGSFGSVYKGCLSEGIYVAVKVLDTKLTGSWKSFVAECTALRYVRHRNLVKLITSCSSVNVKNEEFLALVYDFMSNGNLDEWIRGIRCHEDGKGLNLLERLSVAFDVASVIAYLHFECKDPVVHCDLKPSNVLLDEDMTAKVGDFGIAKLLVEKRGYNEHSLSSTHGLSGSIGYIPPEYGLGEKPSPAGDVYSYGVMLLELFTGKSPTSEEFMGGTNIVKWVQSAFPKNTMQVMDSKLQLIDYEDCSQADVVIVVLEVGLSCTAESPYERITMKDVLCKLTNAREKMLVKPANVLND